MAICHYALLLTQGLRGKFADRYKRQRSTGCRKSLPLSYAPDTARTCNLQFRRLSLYPVELRVLSIADVDHMTQPGFGKTKMQLLKPGNRVRQVPLRLRCRVGTLCSSGCTALTGSQKHGSSSLPSVAFVLVHRLKPASSD
jgi:hypothetical protein